VPLWCSCLCCWEVWLLARLDCRVTVGPRQAAQQQEPQSHCCWARAAGERMAAKAVAAAWGLRRRLLLLQGVLGTLTLGSPRAWGCLPATAGPC
jgi:hypothetical protein